MITLKAIKYHIIPVALFQDQFLYSVYLALPSWKDEQLTSTTIYVRCYGNYTKGQPCLLSKEQFLSNYYLLIINYSINIYKQV